MQAPGPQTDVMPAGKGVGAVTFLEFSKGRRKLICRAGAAGLLRMPAASQVRGRREFPP